MEYITVTCVITEQAVYKNGEKIFTATDAAGSAGVVGSSGLAVAGNFLPALYQQFNWQYPKFYKMDNLSRLGWAAAEILLEGWNAEAYQPEEVALVLSNANSSLDTDYKYIGTTKDIPSPSVFVYTLPNIVIGEICIRHRFKGENAFFLSAAFDPVLLSRYVTYLLEQDIARACVTGWAEWIGNSFKAALFLIEKKETPGVVGGRAGHPGHADREALPFSTENMDRIFKNPTH